MGVPIEEQQLHRTALQSLLDQRLVGGELRGEDLLRAVEECEEKDLPSQLRELFLEFSTPGRKRRGRPPKDHRRAGRTMLQILRSERTTGYELRGEDLLRAIDECEGTGVSAELRYLFPEFSVPARKRRGRPRKPEERALEDLAMEELDAKYRELLERFRQEDPRQRKALHMGPSELAYEQLAGEISCGPTSWEGVRNKHSASRTGKFHAFDKRTHSEDFDAEIDRQFPPSRLTK